MPALPLPGQRPLDPDEVGYVKPSNMAMERLEARRHKPETCEEEHCSCHLPKVFLPPICELTGREAIVLAWHLFSTDDDSDEELSFKAIGKRLGVNEARVRQIYMRASQKIRAHARDYYPPRPGTPEYETRMAAVAKYKAEHPEYRGRPDTEVAGWLDADAEALDSAPLRGDL